MNRDQLNKRKQEIKQAIKFNALPLTKDIPEQQIQQWIENLNELSRKLSQVNYQLFSYGEKDV